MYIQESPQIFQREIVATENDGFVPVQYDYNSEEAVAELGASGRTTSHRYSQFVQAYSFGLILEHSEIREFGKQQLPSGIDLGYIGNFAIFSRDRVYTTTNGYRMVGELLEKKPVVAELTLYRPGLTRKVLAAAHAKRAQVNGMITIFPDLDPATASL